MYKQLTPAYALVKAAWVSRIKQKPTSLLKALINILMALLGVVPISS